MCDMPPRRDKYTEMERGEVEVEPMAWGGPFAPGIQPASDNIRLFSTGATRDQNTDKYDYRGFLSWRAIEEFGAYMHQHRHQSDGSFRAADNWKLGIPIEAYVESLTRHVVQFNRAIENGDYGLADSIAPAIWFNIQGFMHERSKQRENEDMSYEAYNVWGDDED